MFPIFLSNKKCRLEHVVNKLMSITCLITEFLGISSYKLHGILSHSMDTLWHSMELHGTSGNPMAFHGTLRYSLEFHGPPRQLHGISWHSMELHGIPWILHGDSMEVSWNSMDFHRFPWNSDFEVFHTGIEGLIFGILRCTNLIFPKLSRSTVSLI